MRKRGLLREIFWAPLLPAAPFFMPEHGLVKGGRYHISTIRRPGLKSFGMIFRLRLSSHIQKKKIMSGITRSNLIKAINARIPSLSEKDTDDAVRMVLKVLGDSLACGRRIEIRGFGAFDLNLRPARLGRNPRTGEAVAVPAKFAVHFKPGKDMKDNVNRAAQEGIENQSQKK